MKTKKSTGFATLEFLWILTAIIVIVAIIATAAKIAFRKMNQAKESQTNTYLRETRDDQSRLTEEDEQDLTEDDSSSTPP